jgi:hypothetical protein
VIGEIDAVRALLLGLGHEVYFVDVPDKPTYPYFLVWSSTGRMLGPALCGTQTDLDDFVGITAVGETPEAAMVVLERARAVLEDAAPPVAGRSMHLRLFDSRPIAVDRDVTIPPANRHPSTGVDLYRLTSVPA